MQVLINLTEHAYNNIRDLDSISLGRCAYKGVVISALNAIKHGTVINNSNEDKVMSETEDYMKRVIKCKYCGKPEYYGEFRWLSGKMLCRNCYKAWWEGENKQPYKWDDLDGDRPT